MLREEENAKAMRDTRLLLDSFEHKSIIDSRRPIVCKCDYLDIIDYLYYVTMFLDQVNENVYSLLDRCQ